MIPTVRSVSGQCAIRRWWVADMADLLDIAPASAIEIVRVAGGERIKVHGLNANAIAAIVARFPDLVALLGGLATGGANTIPKLFGQFGTAVGPIIAAGCGHLGDEKYEQAAGALLVEDQLKLIKAIWTLTLPNGIGPLMETVTALMTGPADNGKTVRVRLKKSPLESPPSSATDSRPTMQ